MRKTFTLLLMLTISAISFSQKASWFRVEYFTKQRSGVDDSMRGKKIESKSTYTDSNNVQQTITTPLTLDFPAFEFSAVFTIDANTQSSKMFFGAPDGQAGGIQMQVNTPDTIYYSKGVWEKLSEGSREPIETQRVNVKETTEKKTILGYKCIKFVQVDDQKNEEIIFWASKDLPNTLLPFTGLERFKYGILEITHHTLNTYVVATKVTKY